MWEFTGDTVALPSLVLTGIGATIAYFAISRRRIRAYFSGLRLIAAPRDELEIGVIYKGEPVDKPLYLVELQLKCRGNRDITMSRPEDYVEIDVGEGVELVTVRYVTQSNKIHIETVHANAKGIRFRFDLLKIGQTIQLSLYVKSGVSLDYRDIDVSFPLAVQIPDVRLSVRPPNAPEFYGGSLGIAAAMVFFVSMAIFSTFSPVSTSTLYLDSAGRRISLRDLAGASIQTCTASTNALEESVCELKPIAEVAKLSPAPTDTKAYYASSSTWWLNLLVSVAMVLLFGAITLADTYYRPLARWIQRQRERSGGVAKD